MSNTTQAEQGGFPTLAILGLIFVTLKLLGIITWSWWWVTAPFWMPIVIVLVIIGIALAIAGIVAILDK